MPDFDKNIFKSRRSSLRRFTEAQQPQLRLVCFTWCGAGASVYRKLALSLPAHVELFAVQLPGREERFGEAQLRRMEQIVEMLIDEVAALGDRPLVFFGHSMGALVAYEMALALKTRAGCEPAALIVSGHGAPRRRDASSRCWHTASEEEFLENIRELGGTPPELLADRQMMAALIPVLQADYEVLETYAHRDGSMLACPVFSCAGESDREVSREGIADWARYTSGRCHVHWFKGGHFYLNTQPRVLARCIGQWSAEVLGRDVDLESAWLRVG